MLLVFNKWIFVSAACVGAVTLAAAMWFRSKKRIQNHLTTHFVLSDKEFLAALKATPEQYDLCLAIRNATAGILKIPAGTLYASDSMDYLSKLGFDIGSFILELESVRSIDIDYEAFCKIVTDKEYVEPVTFADFIHFFSGILESITVHTGAND